MGLFSPKTKERIVATIGRPGHGKSVFLAGLFWDSFFALSSTVSPYHVSSKDDESRKLFFGNAEALNNRSLPSATVRGKPTPAKLEFNEIPSSKNNRRQSLQLVFYDVAGEVFDDTRQTSEYAPYVTDAHDLIFLFDPTSDDFSALSAAKLVEVVYDVAKGGRKKNIIIALTKMDELHARGGWWGTTIRKYWPDPPPTHSDISTYLEQMDSLSAMLRGWWTDPAQNADNMINRLPEDTRFCAVSSLGHAPILVDGHLRLTKKPEPFRVRDPLFWIFRAAGVM
jgi:hypothetical protein